LNGDGLDDLVQVRFDSVDAWLNVDGTGWPRHHIANTPASPLVREPREPGRHDDSSTRDICWGNANCYRYIDLQGGKRPRAPHTRVRLRFGSRRSR
jgi:hypothetical protein